MAFAGTLDYDPVRAVLRVVGESFVVVLSRLDMRTGFYLSLTLTLLKILPNTLNTLKSTVSRCVKNYVGPLKSMSELHCG